MEESQTPNPDYIKGFNEGYIIAQHMPELAEQLSNVLKGDSTRSQGFKEGRLQLITEQRRERYPVWLRTEPSALQDKNKNAEKDKGKEDMDR